MPISDFSRDGQGVKSNALQSWKNYFNEQIMRFIIMNYADLFTKSKINWYKFEIFHHTQKISPILVKKSTFKSLKCPNW